jgi:hypothetical protein
LKRQKKKTKRKIDNWFEKEGQIESKMNNRTEVLLLKTQIGFKDSDFIEFDKV